MLFWFFALCVFFFKQKTAYELRISDWSSDVCSSDLINIVTAAPEKALEGSFDLDAGSRETVSARAAIGGRTGSLAWRIGGQRFATDGISSHAKAFGGVERDGSRNRNVSGRA